MEGDDDKLEDSDCLLRLCTKCPCCIVIPCAHANPSRRLFHSVPPIVRGLFEDGVYLRVASTHGNTVVPLQSLMYHCRVINVPLMRAAGW